jgi:DNA replication protein DnaC
MIKMQDDPDQPTTPDRRKVTHADLVRVNLPRAFWGSRTDKIQDAEVCKLVTRYRKDIREMVNTGSGLLISGPPGVGKTSVSACILKEGIGAGLETYFTTHIELKDLRFEKRDSLYGNGTDGITIRKKIETAELLVVDGFNESFFVDNVFGSTQLEELLIRRSFSKLTTIMTIRSTVTLRTEKFADLFDIISQCMAGITIGGKNLRDPARDQLNKRIRGEGE